MKGGEDVVGGKWWEDDFAGDETVRQVSIAFYVPFNSKFRYNDLGELYLCYPFAVYLVVSSTTFFWIPATYIAHSVPVTLT